MFWFFNVIVGIQAYFLTLHILAGDSPLIIAHVTVVATAKGQEQTVNFSGISMFLEIVFLGCYITVLLTWFFQSYYYRWRETKFCTCGHTRKAHGFDGDSCWPTREDGADLWDRCACQKFIRLKKIKSES